MAQYERERGARQGEHDPGCHGREARRARNGAHEWDKLPLFADEPSIGAAVLGPRRACEWTALAALYERQGLPKIDEVMGGRYMPAVKAFFDRVYGLNGTAGPIPAAPDGIERPGAWKRSKRRV
jgi:hypothetical protein